MDLGKIGWEGLDWMQLAQDRDQWWALVNTVMNLRVPWKPENFLTSWISITFSRRALLGGVSQSVSQSVIPHYNIIQYMKNTEHRNTLLHFTKYQMLKLSTSRTLSASPLLHMPSWYVTSSCGTTNSMEQKLPAWEFSSHSVKKSPPPPSFLESEGPLLCLQEPASGPYPEPDESNSPLHILFLWDSF